MRRHKLGSSDLEVPIVCLGTMTWGEQNTEEEAFEQLDYALSVGVNFIDTAELYPVPPRPETVGRTETYIGNWLKARGCRDKVIIATKVAAPLPGVDRSWVVANRSEPPGPATQPELDEASIRAALEGSLRRLQTDYVDLYQIHWPARYVPLWGKRQYRVEQERPHVSFEDQVRVMGALIQEGKIRHWGLSNETTYGVCQMCEAAKRLGVPPPVSIQNDFAPVYRHFEEELAEACAPSAYNLGLLAYGVLAGGTLSGKYLEGEGPDNGRHKAFPNFQPRYHQAATRAAASEYAALAKRVGLSPATLTQAWAASRWYMGSVIIGATTMEQLKENIEACQVVLDESTLAEMDSIHLRHRNTNDLD
ncbi:hypothetical protein PLESTB_000368700 [Pleodorina starrii]|uniref:NADP-dependent oxidoreductase domain-containing protein n=1 Tax=Pleodorina starrii TaxID=330485 RepID=A0A9W6BDW2_9CHLO|nr:hypothetical protein PLESTM_000026200 [Pleodorina starrii]GLC50342.1 hypothetical protein PLESTB_000368700 [Pleodorina starrii]GLC64276.1 hypothetical protein PLESTF_000144000 [Pleodorina starrii]